MTVPLGNRRPCPPIKPLIVDGPTNFHPLIAVTPPKGGFRPRPDTWAGKYHPFFSSDYGVNKLSFSLNSRSDAGATKGAQSAKTTSGSTGELARSS